MYSRVCFSSVRENEITVPAMRFREGLMRSRSLRDDWLEGIPHQFYELDKRQLNFVTSHVMAGKGINDPHPGLENRYPCPDGGGGVSTLSNPSAPARERRISSSVASVRDSVFFLLFFSDLRVGTKTPRRISATGCTVLLLLVSVSPAHRTTYPPRRTVF